MTRIYMFVSRNKPELRAFAGDDRGDRLPGKYAPWDATGVIRPEAAPPHGFLRTTIEDAINSQGYQLWRLRAPKQIGVIPDRS
jgi:hypothetical protein